MEEPTPEPNSTRGQSDGPVGGWVVAGPPSQLDRIVKVVAIVFLAIIGAAFLVGLVYGFLADPSAGTVVLTWVA